jgi:hypothetical protein
MINGKIWKRLILVSVCLVFAFVTAGIATSAEKSSKAAETKKVDHMKAFKVYKQKCLLCHDSVADPEKPGRTRDDWILVIKTMHGYGLGLTPKETEQVADLLYSLRRGKEKDPG